MTRWLCGITLSAVLWMLQPCFGAEILMITMGGTKSHKIPFWELARGLVERDHNVTFVSAFPADFHIQGLEEVTPAGLVFYVRNYTNWDLVGSKFKGEEPVPHWDILRYAFESCDAFLDDHETRELIHNRKRYDLFILDGAFPECALGLVHVFKVPFIYINTVAFFMESISNAGSPTPYSVTPFISRSLTDDMGLMERIENVVWHFFGKGAHYFMVSILQTVLVKHLGQGIPSAYDIGKDVSLILQNGHFTMTYPRPNLPSVIEVACIHCKPAKPLNKDLEDFINQGGDNGFIYFSMGSSVKAVNMPEELRKTLMRAFSRLPYQVLWKWEDDARLMTDLPHNVMLGKWLPQQDLLGHRKIRAFVTHGGLLSMFETVYHGIPVVMLPVFCDHETNSAKAEADGYAIKIDLHGLTSNKLFKGINKIINDPKYKDEVKKRQILLRDQKETPLERAVYWTEYVIRHKGAKHLQSPAKNMNFFKYYSIDVFIILLVILLFILSFVSWLLKAGFKYLVELYTLRKVKED